MPAATLDALIIGAGWSGLTAALQLSKAGKKVLCLEARKRLGGRAFTHTWNEDTPMDNNERILPANEKGYTVDFGCSYIHGYEEGNPVKEIAKRYGVNVFSSKPTAMQIIGDAGSLPSNVSDKLRANLGAAQDAAKSLAKERRQSNQQQQQSLASFLFNEKDSPLFSDLNTEQEKTQAIDFAKMLHIPYGVEIEKVSLDHFGYENNFAGTDGIPEGGFTRLISELAKEVNSYGGEIQLGKVVQKVVHLGQGKGVQVQVMEDGNDKETILRAKTAIVTMPLAVLKEKSSTLFEPPLDSKLQDVIHRTTIGNLNKVLLTYKEPWWTLDAGTFIILPTKKHGELTSSNLSLKDIFASTTLIVNSLCASHTGLPSQLTSPSLLVMIGASSAKELERFSRLEVAQALDDYISPRLSSTTTNSKNKELKHTFYSRWSRQDFTKGATTTPVTVGNSPVDFKTLATPLWNDTLYFAGEHCEVNHRGSVAGAVVSAHTTSDQVLAHLSTPAAKH